MSSASAVLRGRHARRRGGALRRLVSIGFTGGNGSPLVANKTRARILKAIAELNYRPNPAARRLATRRSNVIGMVGTRVTYSGPAQVMISIGEFAKRRGYNLMFAAIERSTDSEIGKAICALCEHQVAGLVLAVRVKGRIDLIRRLCRGVPFVTLGAGAAPDVPTVAVDEKHGVGVATRHLLDLGDKQIACIAGPPGWPGPRIVDRRARKLLGRRIGTGSCVEGAWSAESGYQAAVRLLELASGRFTTIWRATTRWHWVPCALCTPKESSCLGRFRWSASDDLPESWFFEPPLTTVHHDFVWEGEQCVKMLFRTIDRESVAAPLHELQRPALVIRASTAAPGS